VPEIGAAFRLPFDEAIAAFRLRLGNLLPTATWTDIWKAQHDRAFVVAGALKAELLADLGAAVDKAVSQGTSLEEFRRDFRRIVIERGWHGWTGEGSAKGEAWRTKVIYRTNLAVSYAAGRRAQLIAGGFEWWVYRHGGSAEPRIRHLGWDGLALPPAHPFWLTHAPPNGWGCSCYVVGARSEAGIRRVGGDPARTLPPDWAVIDPRTGAPVGIDKGWDYAPGATGDETIRSLVPRLSRLPPAPSVDLIQSWLRTELFEAWFAAPTGFWPLVRIAPEQASRLGSGETVAVLSRETVEKQKLDHPELSVWEYAEAQRVVDTATHVVEDGKGALIFVLVAPGRGGQVLVVKATRSGARLFVTSFRRMSSDAAQQDREIRRLLRKPGGEG
jgi:hypothetical protein